MSKEMIIMDKGDYYNILNVIDQMKQYHNDSIIYEIEDDLDQIIRLLEKARDPCGEPITANDRLNDQLNILIDSTTAAGDDALKALNILNGDE